MQASSEPDADIDGLIKDLHVALVDVFRVLNQARSREPTINAAGASLGRELFQSLELIERFSPITLTDLAGRIGVDPVTVGPRVASLRESGLVTLQTGPQDAQACEAVITPSGKAVIAAVDNARRRDGRKLFEDWDEKDVRDLVRLFQKFATAIEARANRK